MNDVNPYASPDSAGGGDATGTGGRAHARWLSLRGALAIVCFLLAACLSSLSVGDFIWICNAGADGIRGVPLVRFGVCAAAAVAFILMGWGIRARSRGVVLVGFVASLPLLAAVSIRLYATMGKSTGQIRANQQGQIKTHSLLAEPDGETGLLGIGPGRSADEKRGRNSFP